MGILPRRNPVALFAYYLGVFALVPVVGLALGPLAVVLGVFGVRAARRKPKARGGGHAWAGVVMGVVAIVVSAVVLIFSRDPRIDFLLALRGYSLDILLGY